MPNYTPNLNLFKYDTTKDGKEVFSIEKALNENWDKLDKGGSSSGLKIGTIMQGFIDESQNKERYLNGGVIVQDQFVSFTSWIKNIVKLYPSLKVTEDQWQAELKLSAKGQCGKFVIDDAKGTIRLPKLVTIQGLFDLSQSGMLKEAGLPNITGDFKARGTSDNYPIGYAGGAFKNFTKGNSGTVPFAANPVSISSGFIFDASRSNSIYGKSNTVQEEAIQYPYYIVVATGSKDAIDVIRQAELNNPFSLFECKWSDKLLNNISWLRSNGQWNKKSVYTDAYNYLLQQYTTGQTITETIAGVSITYKKGVDSNIKITGNKSAYNDILKNTGSAWFYVLDTATEQFCLPQTNGFFQFGGSGQFVAAGLPNITGEIGFKAETYCDNKLFYIKQSNIYNETSSGGKYGDKIGLDASRSNSIYGKSNTVQPNAVKGYLYFYVGETVQNVNLINAGRIEEQLVNKTDMLQASDAGMPSGKFINLTLGATASSYVAPANGWICLACTGTAGSTYFEATNDTMSICASYNGGWGRAMGPIRKGTHFNVYYGGTNFQCKLFRFVYAEGEI